MAHLTEMGLMIQSTMIAVMYHRSAFWLSGIPRPFFPSLPFGTWGDSWFGLGLFFIMTEFSMYPSLSRLFVELRNTLKMHPFPSRFRRIL